MLFRPRRKLDTSIMSVVILSISKPVHQRDGRRSQERPSRRQIKIHQKKERTPEVHLISQQSRTRGKQLRSIPGSMERPGNKARSLRDAFIRRRRARSRRNMDQQSPGGVHRSDKS